MIACSSAAISIGVAANADSSFAAASYLFSTLLSAFLCSSSRLPSPEGSSFFFSFFS